MNKDWAGALSFVMVKQRSAGCGFGNLLCIDASLLNMPCLNASDIHTFVHVGICGTEGLFAKGGACYLFPMGY